MGIMIALFGLLISIQLVPLPPSIWLNLPGREPFAQAATIVGIDQPWRPLAINPDLAINSLMALLPAAAIILLFPNIDRARRSVCLVILGAAILVSGIVGVAQISGDVDSLYLYRITNDHTAVGLMANRNHQALFIVCGFPILAALAALTAREKSVSGRSTATAAAYLGAAAFFVPLILVTGSRAGLALMPISIVGSAALYWRSIQANGGAHLRLTRLRRKHWIFIGGIVVLVAALIYFTVALSKAEAVQRLFSQELAQEKRYILFFPMFEMAKSYFPVGSGFGSFPEVFRIIEPAGNLGPAYMNHAHNELLEIAIEGGLPAILLLGAFVFWASWRAVAAWSSRKVGRSEIFAQAGSVIIIVMLLASLADYPIRAPSLSALFALSCCWLAASARVAERTL